MEFGVREFVNIVLSVIAFYLRHKDAIDDALPPEVKTAMELLSGLVDEIKLQNPPGPL